jgi:hypothetical protein
VITVLRVITAAQAVWGSLVNLGPTTRLSLSWGLESGSLVPV